MELRNSALEDCNAEIAPKRGIRAMFKSVTIFSVQLTFPSFYQSYCSIQ